jgi:hypothetical protein
MGAKKSKRSRSVILASRYGFSRPPQTRKPLPVVVVVCDDTTTAVAYFDELKREVKSYVTVEIIAAEGHGERPNTVVSRAINRAAELHSKDSHDPNDKDSVWALIDLESDPQTRGEAFAAKKKAEKKHVKVALSNPCFEVWTLAHFINTGELFNGCSDVVNRIRTEWKKHFQSDFDNKAQADYSKLMALRSVAIQRAKARSKTDPSWTDVHKVVEEILSHK